MFCCKFTIYDVCVCRCKYKLRLQELGPLDVPNVVSCWTPKKKLNGKKKKDRVGEANATARSRGKKRKGKGDKDNDELGIESNWNLSEWHLGGSV